MAAYRSSTWRKAKARKILSSNSSYLTLLLSLKQAILNAACNVVLQDVSMRPSRPEAWRIGNKLI